MMLAAILKNMERNPTATLSSREVDTGSTEFQELQRGGMLRALPISFDDDVVDRWGKRLTVVRDGDALELIDEDDAELDPVPVTAQDVRRWRLDIDRFVAAIRTANGLAGDTGRLNEHLWLVGSDAERTFIFGLLNDRVAELEFRALRSLLPSTAPDNIVVLCPSFKPSPTLHRELDRLAIDIGSTDLASLAIHVEWPGQRAGVRHDETYTWISVGNLHFPLSPTRSAVIRRLVRADKLSQGAVPWSELQTIAESAGKNPKSMKDLMGSLPGWRQLVKPAGKKGWVLAAQSRTPQRPS